MISRLAPALVVTLSTSLVACTTQVICTTDQVAMNGQCISLASDPANCGAIGHACGLGETCSGSQCCLGSACAAAVYATCTNANTVQGATAALVPVGAPVRVEKYPIGLAWRAGSLWVATSRGNTLDEMVETPAGLAPAGPFPTILIPTTSTSSDLESVAENGGRLYVSNDDVQSLVIVDPDATPSIQREIRFASNSYPQGIGFSSTKGYLALNGFDQVAVLDLASETVVGTIDVSSLASPGASAHPTRVAMAGGRAYVTLWNLDASWSPAGNGRLAVIDTTTDTLVPGANPVDLGPDCLNPAGIAVSASTVWVTCGFAPWDATGPEAIRGAAIVPIDVSGTLPVVGTPLRVTGALPGAIRFCGGYGFVADNFGGNLLRLDPTSKALTARGLVCAPLSGSSSFVSDVACGR